MENGKIEKSHRKKREKGNFYVILSASFPYIWKI